MTHEPGWVTPQEAERRAPGFLASRGDAGWAVDPAARRIASPRFGFAETRVQLDRDGRPAFDRVVYGEPPTVNAVVYGRDDSGAYRVAVVVQTRPFADLPDGGPAAPPIVIAQPCVMGFSEPSDAGPTTVDRVAAAAIREAREEAGVDRVLAVRPLGRHNPNPAFCATWTDVVEVEVDLHGSLDRPDQEELIERAVFVTIDEFLGRIRAGTVDGISYRSATANDAFLIWLAHHPDALDRANIASPGHGH